MRMLDPEYAKKVRRARALKKRGKSDLTQYVYQTKTKSRDWEDPEHVVSSKLILPKRNIEVISKKIVPVKSSWVVSTQSPSTQSIQKPRFVVRKESGDEKKIMTRVEKIFESIRLNILTEEKLVNLRRIGNNMDNTKPYYIRFNDDDENYFRSNPGLMRVFSDVFQRYLYRKYVLGVRVEVYLNSRNNRVVCKVLPK